jgi:hypothetical protein
MDARGDGVVREQELAGHDVHAGPGARVGRNLGEPRSVAHRRLPVAQSLAEPGELAYQRLVVRQELLESLVGLHRAREVAQLRLEDLLQGDEALGSLLWILDEHQRALEHAHQIVPAPHRRVAPLEPREHLFLARVEHECALELLGGHVGFEELFFVDLPQPEEERDLLRLDVGGLHLFLEDLGQRREIAVAHVDLLETAERLHGPRRQSLRRQEMLFRLDGVGRSLVAIAVRHEEVDSRAIIGALRAEHGAIELLQLAPRIADLLVLRGLVHVHEPVRRIRLANAFEVLEREGLHRHLAGRPADHRLRVRQHAFDGVRPRREPAGHLEDLAPALLGTSERLEMIEHLGVGGVRLPCLEQRIERLRAVPEAVAHADGHLDQNPRALLWVARLLEGRQQGLHARRGLPRPVGRETARSQS